MARETHILVVAYDEERDFIGFRPKNARWADPTEGFGACHDLLEHRIGDTGTMEEEMMALGAMAFVRGETYFSQIGSRYTFPENLAGDFPNFHHHFEQAGRRGMRLRYPGRTMPINDGSPFEANVEDLLRHARNLMRSEIGEVPRWIQEGSDDIRGWMRRGYRAAKQRYRRVNVPTYALPGFFIDLTKALDRELGSAVAGDEYRITINHHPLDFRVDYLNLADS